MNGAQPGDSGPSRPRRLAATVLRDPLTHFVLAGGALFAAYGAFAPQAVQPADEMRIEITEGDLRQIALVQLAQGRAAPDPQVLRQLARDEAIQRILAREAVALGLDRDDEIIARRLAQKMDFLLADLAALDEPTQDELRTWYDAHAERFLLPPRASFRHLYFAPDKRGADAARRDAEAALPALADLGPSAPELADVGDRFMFRDYYGGRTLDEMAKEFGPGFARELFAQPTGRWLGPIRSGYGWHLVFVDTLEAGRTAPFETVADAALSAYLEERYREIRERAYDEMLSRYTIVMPDPETLALDPRQAAGVATSPPAALVQ